jgi:transcription initiation factor TFIID subunit TAF12
MQHNSSKARQVDTLNVSKLAVLALDCQLWQLLDTMILLS